MGCGSAQVCSRLASGASGIQHMKAAQINLSPLCNVTAIATIPAHKHAWNDEYSGDIVIGKSKQSSKFIDFAVVAAELALKDAQIESIAGIVDATRAGVAIGNGGIGSMSDISEASTNLTQSFKKLSPYFVPKVLVNMAAGQVSIKFGLQGPVHSVATACAAGAHSIGDAFNFIRLGYADVMLAGGTDASIDPLSLAGFARMKALGSLPGADGNGGGGPDGASDSDVQRTSRPFHQQRNGFVMGEGAGVLVLEELSVALKRGANILAEVCGYGLSGDAFNATSPPAEGDGAVRSMHMAIQDAGISAHDIGYVNAHATSTPVGDAAEVAAIRTVFGSPTQGTAGARKETLYVSSTKGATGHLLGAAGAVESIFTVWALHSSQLPPTLNLDQLDPALQGGSVFSHVPNVSVKHEFRYALKNSFGFGGTNASLVFGRYIP